jgi:hypothetical protein
LIFSACPFKTAFPSAAKAGCDLIGFIGTTEVVPFQNGFSDEFFRVPFQNGFSD